MFNPAAEKNCTLAEIESIHGGAEVIQETATRRLPKLETLRGFAAIYVLFYHLSMDYTKSWGWYGFPFRLGQEAVMIFFVLSGFVVFLSTERSKPSFKAYFVSRAARIFPIFLLALLIGGINAYGFQGIPFPWGTLVGNLCMLQDSGFVKPGTWFPAFGENSPLWSLAYEWWFYTLFFPVWLWVGPRWRLTAAAAISGVGLGFFLLWPNQLSLYAMYFILWWAGAEMADEFSASGKVTWLGQSRMLLVLSAFVVSSSVALCVAPLPRSPGIGGFPILMVRHFVAALAVCVGALLWQNATWWGFEKLLKPFHIFAAVSYAIYAFHFPVCINRAYLANLGPWYVEIPVSIALLFSLAYIAEHHFQPAFARLFRPRHS